LKGLALTEDGLRELAIAARVSASDLLSAARVLNREGHLALARAVFLMALQEVGKVVLCLEGLFGSMTPSDVLDAWDIHREKLSRGHQFALLHVADRPVTTDLAEWLTRVVETDLAGKVQALYVDPSPRGRCDAGCCRAIAGGQAPGLRAAPPAPSSAVPAVAQRSTVLSGRSSSAVLTLARSDSPQPLLAQWPHAKMPWPGVRTLSGSKRAFASVKSFHSVP
jgi:AbiV family abortive infection protein